MKKQFPFSTQGVQDWQDEVYATGQSGIDAECVLIANDFVHWLSERFGLADTQTQFLDSLGPLTHQSYSASIQNALQHLGPITLEKEDRPTAFRKAQNPKVVYHEERLKAAQQNQEAEEPHEDELEVSVDFRIEYPEE